MRPFIHSRTSPSAYSDRKIGFEFEFINVEFEDVSDLIVAEFGGEVCARDEYLIEIKNSIYGDFRLECDSTFVKDRVYANWMRKVGWDLTEGEQRKLDEQIADYSQVLIPRELVTPPIPIADFPKIDYVVKRMQQFYSVKQDKKWSLAPCGLHLNIECEELTVGYLLNTLRAFCILYDDLLVEAKVDLNRRLAPYIKAFPDKYINLISSKRYKPDLEAFVEDYFTHNPTRNRALDMSVIFAHINPEWIKGVDGLETSLIKPRPAFHYRLPNCELDNPNWSIGEEWKRWKRVESLAQELMELTGEGKVSVEAVGGV